MTLLNVDDLSRINLKYGRECGNGVLEVLRDAMNDACTGEQRACRINGNCFCILLSETDEEQVKAFQTAQDAANAEEEEPAVTPPAPDEEAESENQEPQVTEKKPVNMLPVVGVIAVLIACGGGYFMMQTKKKKASEQRPDPDADYTEDDDDEYEIPEDDNDEDESEYLDEDDSEEVEDSQE